MNQPRGFRVVNGEVVDVDPWAAMFNPAIWPQSVHMILAAFMVTGFVVASVYAVAMLRGRTDRYHRLGLLIPFTMAALVAPLQIGVGDWAAQFLAENQPIKLAAMEGLYQTQANAPLSIGGYYSDGEMHYALEIPSGLSVLAYRDPDATVIGLESVPEELRPPVNVVHLAFDIMVGIGFALLAMGIWLGIAWWRRRDLPRSRWFLRATALSGLGAVVALESGWVVTEVGRQPWIVYNVMRVEEAINPAPGLRFGFYVVLAVYTLLTAVTVYVLRRLARQVPVPHTPQEDDVKRYPVP